MRAGDINDPHVRNVKEASRAPHGPVLVSDGGVPQRHLPPGKGSHFGPVLHVPIVERSAARGAILLLPLEGRKRLSCRFGIVGRGEADEIRFVRDGRRRVRGEIDVPAQPTLLHIQLAHDDRPWQFGPQVSVVETHVPIGKVTQPGDDPPGAIRRHEQPVAKVGAGALEQPAAHHPPIPLQQRDRPPLSRRQVADVVGRDLFDKSARPAPFNFEQAILFLPLPQFRDQAMMRVAGAWHLEINPGPLCQVGHLLAQLLQHIEIYLAPVDRAAHAGVGDRLGALHSAGDDLGNLFHLRLPQAALSDPGRAQPDTAGIGSRLVAGDGIFVDDQAHHVEDRSRDATHQRSVVAPAHGFAVEQQQVSVGAATGDAQAVTGEGAGQSYRVSHRLVLKCAELLSLRQAESDGHSSKLVDVGAALQAGKDGPVDPGR